MFPSEIDVDQGLLYCYMSDICEGGHPVGQSMPTTIGDCCEGAGGGRSWGLAGGHESSTCQPCANKWGDDDPLDMLKPGGMCNEIIKSLHLH